MWQSQVENEHYSTLSELIRLVISLEQGRRKMFLVGWAPIFRVFSIIIPLEKLKKKALAAANINFDDAMYTVCRKTNGVLQVQLEF